MTSRYDLVAADGAQLIREDGRPVLQVIGTASDDALRLVSVLNRAGALGHRLARIHDLATADD
jgi:hypothetical protein